MPKLRHLLIIFLPLIMLCVLRFLGFDGLYGQDAYEYLRYSNAVKESMASSSNPGPFYWPIMYPVLGSLLSFVLGSTSLGLQLISCFSFGITCYFIYKTLVLLHSETKIAFHYTIVFAMFCPFMLKMGLIIMSDALALAFITLTIYYFFKAYYREANFTNVFVFATCALISRYASLVVIFPIIICALYFVFKRKQIKPFLLALFLSLIAALPYIILKRNTLFEASENYFLKQWSVSYYFKSDYTTQDGFQSYKLPNLIYALSIFFHPGFIFIGIALCVIMLKRLKLFTTFYNNLFLLCSLVYILFLAGIPFQNPRILGLVTPLVLLFLYPAFLILLKHKIVKRLYNVLFATAIMLQIVFFTLTFKRIYNRSMIEKEIVSKLQKHQKHTLYSFDMDLALQGHGLHFDYKNLYTKRYKHFNRNDLILFNLKRFRTQWHDKNPMLNWSFITKNYNITTVETYEDGWTLYRIN